MDIKVNRDVKKFYIAFPNQWAPVFGHEMTIGKYGFFVCSTAQGILISEKTSGNKLIMLDWSDELYAVGTTKESFMRFLEGYGAYIRDYIMDDPKRFDDSIFESILEAEKLIGVMPELESTVYEIDEEGNVIEKH